MNQYSPIALAALRIMSGLLFLAHGTQKFFHFPAGDMAGSGWALDQAGAFAGIIELVTGLLIALGLFTRPAAFVASGTMAVAYFMAHVPRGSILPIENMGEITVALCFGCLYIATRGGGPYSLDALLFKRRN